MNRPNAWTTHADAITSPTTTHARSRPDPGDTCAIRASSAIAPSGSRVGAVRVPIGAAEAISCGRAATVRIIAGVLPAAGKLDVLDAIAGE